LLFAAEVTYSLAGVVYSLAGGANVTLLSSSWILKKGLAYKSYMIKIGVKKI
jgi:hypothetical protein